LTWTDRRYRWFDLEPAHQCEKLINREIATGIVEKIGARLAQQSLQGFLSPLILFSCGSQVHIRFNLATQRHIAVDLALQTVSVDSKTVRLVHTEGITDVDAKVTSGLAVKLIA
jgi:hypothetical protein